MKQAVIFDLKQGLMKALYKYIFIAMTSVYFTLLFRDFAINQLGEIPSFLDYIAYIFRGMKVYNVKDGIPFEIPLGYIIMNIIMATIIGDYVVRDYKGVGKNVLVRMKKRTHWWFGKCVWNMVSVLLFYLTIYGVCFIMSIFDGSKKFCVTKELMNPYFGRMESSSKMGLILVLIIAPICMSLAISIIQMLLSLMLSPIYGYLIVLVIYVLSAYFFSPWLIGNHCMIYRTQLSMDNGLQWGTEVLISLSYLIISIIVGTYCINRKDII